MSKVSTKENIVIVGGGLGGAAVAKELSGKLDHSKYNLIVVEARPYLVYMIGGARMAVTTEKGSLDEYLLRYDDLFTSGNVTVKNAKVEKIIPNRDGNGGELQIRSSGGNPEPLPYRFLVLATGSKWAGPIDFPENDADIRQFVSQWQERFKSAENIVIVGGGAVGIEIAGELRDEYANKKITIVQGDDKLLNGTYSNRFRNYMATQLRARNIGLVLGEYVDNLDKLPPSGSGELVFRSGQKMAAGLVVASSGPVPNTAMIGESLGPDVLTKRKNVIVERTHQLKRHPSIFALGDIIDVVEQKQAFKAFGHGAIIATNILSLLNGSEAKKEYKTGTEMMIVTNGKNGGAMYVGILWGLVFGNWAARMLKAKDVGLGTIVPKVKGA